jgi:cytochrome c-type biogenesis protein
LATVLALAASEASLVTGVKLLFVYSLGLGIPFILAAVAVRPFISFMQRFRRHLDKVEKVMGAILVLTGLLFLTGSINWFGSWMLDTFPGLGEIEAWVTPKDLGTEIMQQGTGQ